MRIAINYFPSEKTHYFFHFDYNKTQDERDAESQCKNRLNLFKGSFTHSKQFDTNYTIYALDDYDTNLVRNIPLKPSEKIYRCDTDMTRRVQPEMQFLVKINVDNGLVYFLTEEANKTDVIEFEGRGCQMNYLNLLK